MRHKDTARFSKAWVKNKTHQAEESSARRSQIEKCERILDIGSDPNQKHMDVSENSGVSPKIIH